MLKATRRLVLGLTIATGLAAASASVSAQLTVQDGLVNVTVGNISLLNDARVGVAAQLAAQVCGLKVGPIAVLGAAVDRGGGPATVCNSAQGPVTISQN